MAKVINPYRPKSLREQCDKCRHFTGIGTSGERHKRIEDRQIEDIDGKQDGRGWCAAGVYYNDVMKRGSRGIALPCFRPIDGESANDGIRPTCPKQSFKTAEELDAEVKAIEEDTKLIVQRISVVRPAILKHAGWIEKAEDQEETPYGERRGKPARESASGSFLCPVCKAGTLRYRISGYNGHVHASCTTKECVSWME